MATMEMQQQRAAAPVWPMLRAQTKAELVAKRRNPMFAVLAVGFPVLLFALLGLPNLHETEAGANAAAYIMASFAAYGAISVMLFSFGVAIAHERGQGTNVLMRATPLRPAVHFAARIIAALVFLAATLAVLLGLGMVAGNVHLSATSLLALVVRLALGSLPFMALGFVIGYLVNPSAAAVLTNILFFLMAFASGFYAPISKMGDFIQTIAPYLPSYRLGELAWNAVGATTDHSVESCAIWLLGYGTVFFALAIWAYGREQQRTFE